MRLYRGVLRWRTALKMPDIKSKALVYKQYGDPKEVLELVDVNVANKVERGEVLVKWLASPINPLDINRIQGSYVANAPLPAIGGSEGVGKVLKTAPGSKFNTGDHVTFRASIETPLWTEFGIAEEDQLFKIDKRIDIPTAATFMINPPTAWLMLRLFVNVGKGDYIIQNSANSGVGRNVIQLCKAWGIKTINLVRDRPNIEELKTELWRLGADHVFTEEEFPKAGKQFLKELEAPIKLALNGVGGRSAMMISSALEHGGTCLVYGGMSKKPHEFSTTALLFKNVTVKGFVVGMWTQDPANEEIFQKCMAELEELAIQGKIFAPPMDFLKMADFATAIERSQLSRGKKQLFIINQEQSKL